MGAESYRHNPQRPEDKVRAQRGETTDSDERRAEVSETDLHDVAREEHGLDHGELKQHAQEFEESAGQTLSPTVDPPNAPDPEEHTAPPQ